MLKVRFDLAQSFSTQECIGGSDVTGEANLSAFKTRAFEQPGKIVGVAIWVVDEPLAHPAAGLKPRTRILDPDVHAAEAS